MTKADQVGKRERFGSRVAFYFAAVGSAVGFGNVWRFPSLAYDYGGGAFFIPYLMALFLIGIPVLFLEIALGQFYQRGDVSVFASMHKRMRGIGLSSISCGFITMSYYSMLLGWVLRTLLESGKEAAPWGNEDVTAADSVGYFQTEVLGLNTSLVGKLWPTRMLWPNVGYVFLGYIIIFFCSAFGMNILGKITYFTMGFPVVILFVFLIRGCTLDGSNLGIKAYIGEWDVSVLRERGDVWSTACSQIFFSLSVTFGVMTAYASHLPRTEPAFLNTCVIAFSNSLFSFIAGFAVFSAIGHLAFLEDKTIDELDKSNLSSFNLIFGTWPVVLGTLPGGIHWIRLLFFTLFLLGIDSAFSFVEAVVTCTKDTLRFRNTPKWIITLVFCVTGFLCSLIYATDSGLFFLDAVDFYINFLMLLVGLFESFGVGWIYGIESQIEQFGAQAVFYYMFGTFGSVLFGSTIWFGLKDKSTALWAGFLVLGICYTIGIGLTYMSLKGNSFYDLAMGNMIHFKNTLEPTIGHIPILWCYLIKHFVPQVLLILFINLAASKNSEGESQFGHYGSYAAWPYQIIGILTSVFAMILILVGAIFPEFYAALDTHSEAIPVVSAAEKLQENETNEHEIEGTVLEA